MKYISFERKIFAFILSLVVLFGAWQPVSAATSKTYPIIILSQYSASLSVGEEFLLVAVASHGKLPSFKSSNSKIASVDVYGRVTAKQAGSCRIRVKAASSEVSCSVKVKKTQISVNSQNIFLENGESFQLKVSTTGKQIPTFSSNKKSVAVVDSGGLIIACKPGDAVIAIRADKTTINCRVKVKKPTIKLSQLQVNLFRCQQVQLTAEISSGQLPVWKSSKSSVATVDESGLVVAQKHGKALVTAKVDGSTQTCEVLVQSPEIKLEKNSLSLSVGEKRKLSYTVSSGNTPTIKSSKPAVVKVDKSGNLKAKSKGTSIITFSEDGTRETCTVRVSK